VEAQSTVGSLDQAISQKSILVKAMQKINRMQMKSSVEEEIQ
jgi:hypothetical protein